MGYFSIPTIFYVVPVLTVIFAICIYRTVYTKPKNCSGSDFIVVMSTMIVALAAACVAGGIVAGILFWIGLYSEALAWLSLIAGLIMGVAIYRLSKRAERRRRGRRK